MKGDEIVRACDLHWDETVTLTKHVTKYKYMRKWMVELLSKSQSRVIKIARVNSTLSIYFNFLCAVSRDDVIESTRFLMRPPVIIPPWMWPWKKWSGFSIEYIKKLHSTPKPPHGSHYMYLLRLTCWKLSYNTLLLNRFGFSLLILHWPLPCTSTLPSWKKSPN